MREQLWRSLEARTESLKQQFAQVEDANIRSVPEDIFLYHFLPTFSGENKENIQGVLSYWYAISGTPYAPVKVINEHGTVVAVVPPVLDREALPVTGKRNERGGDMDSVFENARQKASLSPNLAQSMIVGELEKRFLNKVTDKPNSKIQEQWIALLKHYGKSKDQSKQMPTLTHSSTNESDFEYE